MSRFVVRQCSTVEIEDYQELLTRGQTRERWHLNLNAYHFERFPERILDLAQIEELLFCETNIRCIPEDITKLSNLKVLKLRRIQLETFPSSVCGLGQLEELDLSRNEFGKVCSTISQLKNLKALSLSATGLCGELCEEIGQLHALETLDVSRNKLSTLPMSMKSLGKLRKLDLSRNGLKVGPAVLSDLESLEVLDISYNALKEFEIDLPKGLRNLDLEKNCLVTFPDVVAGFTELRRLDLAKNEIRDIPESIASLSKLKELWLEDNCLEALPDVIGQLDSLEVLCIYGNGVKTIARTLSSLQNLKMLDAGRCGLKDFPVAIHSLRQLQWLVLRNNYLTSIPSQLPDLSKLCVLDVEGNKLSKTMNFLCQRGVRTVFNYLKEINEKKTVHQKLIFLGSEGAGKTTLCKVLLTGKPQPCRVVGSQRAKTIVLDQWTWADPDAGTTLQMFDFGGDESYQMVQHLFLDRHSIMLLVVNMHTYKEEDYDERVGSWLQLLQARAPGAPLHLVGTHTDLCKQQEVTEKQCAILDEMRKREETDLRNVREALDSGKVSSAAGQKLRAALETRPELPKAMYLVSCASQNLENIAPLKATIADDAKKYGREIPASWQTLYEGIRRKDHQDFLTLEEVAAIDKRSAVARSHSVSEDPKHENVSQKTPLARRVTVSENCVSSDRLGDILSFFHSIGELVWFENSDRISKYVFHQSRFLIRVLKTIFPGHIEENLKALKGKITDGRLEKARSNLNLRGLMGVKVLKDLWTQQGLNPQVVDTLVELLHQFDLCYELPADPSRDKELCFPRLLQNSSNETDTSFEGAPAEGTRRLIVLFERCNQFPAAIYEKVAVRMHRHVQDVNSIKLTKDNFAARMPGKTNVFLQHHVPDGKCIRLVVEGQDDSDAWVRLVDIREEIEQILADWPGVCYDTWLLCPHCVKAGHVAEAYKFEGTCVQLEPPGGEEGFTCHRERVSVPLNFFKEVTRDIPSQEKLIHVAQEFGQGWRMLGRVLKLKDSHIKDIDNAAEPLSEKCYQVLLKWKQMRVSKATCAELMDALKSLDRKDLAEFIMG